MPAPVECNEEPPVDLQRGDPATIDSDSVLTFGGRLMRVLLLERSVVEAKQALGEAERALQSVHAGLALEPMPAGAGALVIDAARPSETAEQPRPVFDAVAFHRSLPLSKVPLLLQAVALLVAGWCLAYVLVAIVGPVVAGRMAGAFRAPFAYLATGGAAAPSADTVRRGASVAVPESVEPVLATGEAPVVIYERTSPYPQYFAAIAAADRHCLAEAIYYEARGEPVAGQIAVGQVILNRALAGSWPKKVCEVTHQGVENAEKCQFSFACQRSLLSKPFGDAWDGAQALAGELLAGGAWLEEMLDATHFHRIDLKPVWRLSLVEVGRFGHHVFYNSPTENRRPLSRGGRR